MESLRRRLVTVQEVITPVPAVKGSGQAGSRPSSSNDRNATPVKSLAEVADRATSTLNEEDGEFVNIFKRGDKLMRSPPGTPHGTPSRTVEHITSQPNAECLPSEPARKEEAANTPLGNTETPLQLSPREELISKARIEEEQTLLKCRTVLSKMRLAITKQKNISMDIKKGISELDELLDVINNHRRSWKMAEKEQKKRDRLRRLPDKNQQVIIVDKSETPVSNKRTASSPAQEEAGKKHKADEQERDWQTVINRKKRNRSEKSPKVESAASKKNQGFLRKKPRSDAMLIKPKEGHTYAEVLQNMRSKVNPEDSDVKIKTIRKTANGAILLELEKGEKINSKLADAIKSTVLGTAEMIELTPKIALEILDLDSYTTCEEVTEAIRNLLKVSVEEIKVTLSAPNHREQKRAVVTVSNENADILLKYARIKIGWINCRMRLYSGIRRCFRCLSPGHSQWECKGPDRRNQCIKCGGSDHQIKECRNKLNCCLCTEKSLSQVDHISGSNSCPANVNQRQ